MDPRSSPDAPTLPPETPSHAETIGSCRLLRKLGEGGMGEVWLAEQQQPVRRKVALKIIKLGMDTREVVARFAAEQQALALMDHPGIARMFDAGATPEGRPYFVMEFVPGVPLHEYCDTARLTIPERLALFQQICAAVQHAHHKAIIHRDLKPSNVLVSDAESGPTPKIIDFGIAKAMVTPLTNRTMVTQAGGALGTPEYMSPEQLDPAGVDVDTRSDVYALGVILYELLTGAPPIETSGAGSLEEIRQRIRTQEPVRPSIRVHQLGAEAHKIADKRRANVATLTRTLRRDLDWILLKALEKDRNRRYGSPTQLADDVQRHLTSQPVTARPPSASYRVNRFVARHRAGFAISCAAAILLVAFAATMAVLATRLARERDRVAQEAATKERIANFLQELFAMAAPDLARGRVLTARDVLQRGVERINEVPAEQPALRADLLSVMGNAFQDLGEYAEAERLFQQERDVAETIGAHSQQMLRAMLDLGHLWHKQGRQAESAAMLEAALTRAENALGLREEVTLNIMDKLALTYSEQGHLDQAAQLAEQAVSMTRESFGADHEATLSAQSNLAMLYDRQGRVVDAIRVDEATLASRRRILGSDHPNTLRSMNNLANGYHAVGRLDEARKLLAEAITIGEKVWGEEHPSFGITIHSLGEVEFAARQYEAAIGHFNRALDVYKRRTSHQYLPQVLYQLAQANARAGRPDPALNYLAQSLRAGYKPRSPITDDPHLASVRSDPRFPK